MIRIQTRLKRARTQVDMDVIISGSLGRYKKDEYVLVDSGCRLPPKCVISENKSGKYHSANHKLDYQT